MDEKKVKRKAIEIYKFLFCQHSKTLLYVAKWLLGMNNVPQEYRTYILNRYGIYVGNENVKEVDLTKIIDVVSSHKWNKFTLSEFNSVNRSRAKRIPDGIFSYLTPQAWGRLHNILQEHEDAYSKNKNEVLESNLGLIYAMLNKAVRNRNTDGVMSLEDANSEAYIAASRAFDHFLIGVSRLSTYMAIKIEQAVKEKFDNNVSTIKTPGYIQRTLRKMLSVLSEFEEKHGRKPTSDEIAEITGHPKGRIESLMNIDLNNIVSLDAPIGDDDDETGLHDLIAAPENENIYDYEEALLSEILDMMTSRERRIICYRFGLRRSEILASEGIGEKMKSGAEMVKAMCDRGRQNATCQFRKLSRNA